MPHVHQRAFRVRHYECDAYGHVNNVHYLRYMQEAAFDAAAAVGYGFVWYLTHGHFWLVRETEISYEHALQYGDTVTVRTWVEDFRRSRSRRVYEMTRQPGGETVARAKTDWVYVEAATGRPASVPAEMVAAFGLSAEDRARPRARFPEPPPPPAGVFKLRRGVQWRDLDTLGHVNNAVYMDYVGDCGMDVLKAFGWSQAQMRAEGFGILVKRHQIQYRDQARLDDEVDIATWVSGVRGASATRHYVLTRAADGEALAQVHARCAWIDLASGRPIRIPPHFIEAFAANIAAGG